MAAKIIKGIVDIGRPTRIGDLFVLVEPMDDAGKAYVHIAASREAIAGKPLGGKRLTYRPRKL